MGIDEKAFVREVVRVHLEASAPGRLPELEADFEPLFTAAQERERLLLESQGQGLPFDASFGAGVFVGTILWVALRMVQEAIAAGSPRELEKRLDRAERQLCDETGRFETVIEIRQIVHNLAERMDRFESGIRGPEPQAQGLAASSSDTSVLRLVVRREGSSKLSFEVQADLLGFHNKDLGSLPLEGDPKAQAQEELGRRVDDLSDLASTGERGQESARHQLADMAVALFQKLPQDVRDLLWSQVGQIETLQILSDEPYIPWELMKLQGDGGEEGPFLCEAFRVTRWLRDFPQTVSALPLQRIALVLTTDSNLPSAEKEKADLLVLLGAERLTEIEPSFSEVKKALLGGDYDGWHFAGHGSAARVQDPNRRAIELRSGEFLTPENLGTAKARLSRLRPLIFLNGCDTGRGGFSLTGLGGWAQQSLAAGAGAFIGTLWPVLDQKARSFAQAFYRFFLGGEAIPEAVRKARLKVRDRFPGDPAWLAYTVYCHPDARVHSKEGRASGISRPTVRHVPEIIRSRILSFDWLISRKTEGFVGRQWLFDSIDQFVRAERSGYFVIDGEPGAGKSAVIAEMVRRHGHPHHFNIRRAGIQAVDQFLPSLCAQIVARFSLDDVEIPSGVSRDSVFLTEFLERVAAHLRATDARLVLLVDALDESETGPVLRRANPLYLPTVLPDGIFFVVTSRPSKSLLSHQVAERRLQLDQEAGSQADVRLYIEGWLPRSGIHAYLREQRLDAPDFMDRLAGLSRGNFMYLSLVLPEIDRGTYNDRVLPAGLQRYYEDHWDLLKSQDLEGFLGKQPILGALAASKGPISAPMLSRMSGARLALVLASLDEWRQFIEILPNSSGIERLYQIYHESFRDFLANKIDLREASARAAEALSEGLPEP